MIPEKVLGQTEKVIVACRGDEEIQRAQNLEANDTWNLTDRHVASAWRGSSGGC